jgi:hypothetical protein
MLMSGKDLEGNLCGLHGVSDQMHEAWQSETANCRAKNQTGNLPKMKESWKVMMDSLNETGANNSCGFEITLPWWEEPRDAIGVCRMPRDVFVITCCCCSRLNIECPSICQYRVYNSDCVVLPLFEPAMCRSTRDDVTNRNLLLKWLCCSAHGV